MDELPASVEVVIVGGGFAGMATAWWLRRRGVAALVLEREPELGVYASGRSAGLGRQLAEDDATTALTVRGAALLREHFAAAWTASGGMLSFDDPAHLDAYAARAARAGVVAEMIDRAAVLARWPALTGLRLTGALAVPSDGVIEVRVLLAAFAEGVRVAKGVAVRAIEPVGAGVRVETSGGTIAARVVVDAAGAWAGELTRDPPLDALKRHVFTLAAEPERGGPYLWHLGRDEMYVRDDGGVVLTSPCDEVRTAPADQQPDAAGEASLRAILAGIAPALASAPIVRRWACQRSFTPDRRMRLGRDPARPWLVWAAGLGGHGATASPAVGELVGEAVLAAI